MTEATLADEFAPGDKTFLNVHETTVAIYQAGADLMPVSANPIYMGPQCHTVEEGESLKARARRASGEPFERRSIEAYEISLKITGQWAHQNRSMTVDGGEAKVGRVPRLAIDQTYVIVVIWRSRRRNVWVKRVYYNCRLDSSNLAPERQFNLYGCQFTASWAGEETGSNEPTREAVLLGTIRYTVGGNNPVDCYTYNLTTLTLNQLVDDGDLANQVDITLTADGWELDIAGTRRCRWFEDGSDQVFECAGFMERSPETGSQTHKRAEFWVGRMRTMVVDELGRVWAPNLWEQGAPEGASAFNWWFRHYLTETEVELREV